MPRNVRNSWVELDVDGRASTIATGPRAADGGMVARFYMRYNGEVLHVLTVRQTAKDDGTIEFSVSQSIDARKVRYYQDDTHTEMRSAR